MELTICPLLSGSSGNAVYIQGQDTCVLIDAGASGKAVERALCAIGASPQSLSGILVTHEHDDHVKGVGVLSRRYDLPVYANASTWQAMQPKVGEIAPKNCRVVDVGQDFFIQSLGLHSFPIPHDAAAPVGYSCFCGQAAVSVATDLGCVTAGVVRALSASDVVLLEANHDEAMVRSSRYPRVLQQRILGNRGHLCNRAAGDLALRLVRAGVGHIILGHLSAENNSEALAMATVRDVLLQNGVQPETDLRLLVAHRDKCSPPLRVRG